jgi:hypothetical protein
MRYILEALAAITVFATMPIERLLHEEARKMGWGATLAVVTAVVTDELQAEMLRLHRAGRRMALVSLDNDFTEEAAAQLGAQGITIYRLPHRLGIRESRFPTGEGVGEPVEEWMRPEGYDPHAAFRPSASSNGEKR